jgi:catechol 2,3-dioxygenase-like lactoylglutathione lyase family enzyme
MATHEVMVRPPAIEGIIETILYVDDLAQAVAFYRDELGLKAMTGDPARFQSFQVGEKQVLLLFKRGGTLEPTVVPGGIIPPHDGTGPHHIGFAVTREVYEQWRAHLSARGIAIESETNWPRGGRSLYFRDPDNHLLELITPGIWPNY